MEIRTQPGTDRVPVIVALIIEARIANIRAQLLR